MIPVQEGERAVSPTRRLVRTAGGAGTWAAVLVAAAAMLGMGWWGLARGSSMTNDEAATRWAGAFLGLHQLAHLLSHTDAVHGLYYLFIHGWTTLGSTSPEFLRVPSVLGLTVAVALLVIIGRRLTGSAWVGLFAALFLALTPGIDYYAQTARSYAIVIGAATLLTLVLLVALDAEVTAARRARRWWVLYALLVALCGYLNELSLAIVAAHAITVLVSPQRRRLFPAWLGSAAVGGVLVGPLAWVSSHQTGAVSWIPRPTWADVWSLARTFFGSTPAVAALLLACAVLGAVVPPTRLRPQGGAARPAVPSGVTLTSVAAPVLVLPPALLMIVSAVVHPLYDHRYVMYAATGGALLAGAGVVTAGRLLRRVRIPVWLPGVAVCAVVFGAQFGVQQAQHLSTSRGPDYGDTAFYVAAHDRSGDGVIFLDGYYRKVKLGYPAQFRGLADVTIARSPAQVGDFRGRLKPFPAVRPLLLRHSRIWTLGPQPFARVPAPGTLRDSLQLLRRRYEPIRVVHFPGMVVRLWQRRTG